DGALESARKSREEWGAYLDEVFQRVDVIATPTLTVFPPSLHVREELLMASCTLPLNLAGVPALAIPVPTSEALPASVQLIGPMHGEEKLLAAGLALESALSTLSYGRAGLWPRPLARDTSRPGRTAASSGDPRSPPGPRRGGQAGVGGL